MHRLILILISLVMANNGFAANITNLYQGQLPVLTQTADERNKIAPDVLKKVLLKVVGDSAALNSADISFVLDETEQYILQYQYHRMNKISDDLTQPDQLELQLKFDGHAINQTLTKLGLPIWGTSRPEVLLWLAIDDAGIRSIVGEDSVDNIISDAIKQAMDERGLPILMPLMDLQDQTQLSFADLWAGFPEPILQASQRYGAQVIVIARVMKADSGSMAIRWQSLTNNDAEHWQSKGSAKYALQAGISELADRTARRFTQVIDNQYAQRYDLQISNVKGYADYIRVKEYLTKLHTISDVKLSNLADDRLDISVLLSSDLAVFNQTIAIDRILEEEATYTSSNNVIHYKLAL